MKFKAEEQGILLDIVMDKIGYSSKTKARNYIKGGSVMLDGEVVKIPSTEVSAGQEIVTGPRAKVLPKSKQAEIEILYEDEFCLIANKPCKINASRTHKGGNVSFKEQVEAYVKTKSANLEDVYPINYLHTQVSGYMIFAKHKKHIDDFTKAWKTGYKSFYAVVDGKMAEQQYSEERWLKENEHSKMVVQEKRAKYVRKASIHLEVIKTYDRPFTAVEIRPETFVKDQERAILKSLSHPVVGDTKYKSSSDRIKRMAMHNWRLKMKHPINKRTISIEVELPKRLLDF